MPRPAVLALVAALALLLLGAGWWLGRGSAALESGNVGTALSSAIDAAPVEVNATVDAVGPAPAKAQPAVPVAAASPAATSAAPEPLPPPETAVADMLEPLLERARRGDARAACRLASELQRCRFTSRRMMDPQGMEARVAGESDPQRRESMIANMARMEEEHERSAKVCNGVDEAALDLAFPLQMQAARARPELRLWTALSPALDMQMFVNDLDRWQEYRQVALPWLEAAAAEGDLSAIVALARVHGDDRRPGPPIPPFRQIDDARFLTYASLLERYGLTIPPVQRGADDARARLDPAALAAAEREADALFRPEAVIAAPEAGGAAMQRSVRPVPDAAACE